MQFYIETISGLYFLIPTLVIDVGAEDVDIDICLVWFNKQIGIKINV